MKVIASAVLLLTAIGGAGAGCRSMTGQTVGQNIDDATVTAQVRARLVAAETENLTRVDLDTQNGTVYLNGIVDTAAQKAAPSRSRAPTKASSAS